jgi:YVTN family beta-propeller protein
MRVGIWLRAAVAVGIATLFLATGAPMSIQATSQGAHFQHGLAAQAGRPATLPSSIAGVPQPSNNSTGTRVADTLVLFNDTLVPGNFLAGNGIEPYEFAYAPQTGEVFVTDYFTGLVSVINDSINEVVATIPGEWGPGPIAYDSARGEIFVGTLAGRVNVFNCSTYKQVASVYMGLPPQAMVYASDLGEMYVVDGTENVSVINDTTNSIVANATTPGAAFEIGYDPGMDEVLVDSGYNQNNTLSVISATTNAIVANITVPRGTPAYDPANGDWFVPDGNRNVSIISDTTNKLVSNYSVGRGISYVVYDPALGDLYVGNGGSNNVTVASATNGSIIANISTGSPSFGLLYDSGNHLLYDLTEIGALVGISTLTDSVASSTVEYSQPWGSVYDSEKGELFLTDARSTISGDQIGGSVRVINSSTNREVANIPSGIGGVKLAYDQAHGEIFVAASSTQNVSAISDVTDTVVANVHVGYLPDAIVYDGRRGEIFVGDATNNVSVINDTNDTVVATIPLGGEASGFAYIAATGEVYVTHGENLTIINDTNNSVVRTIPLVGPGGDMVYDPMDREVYVVTNVPYFGGFGLSHVTVVNVSTGRVVANVTIGKSATGIALDSLTGQIFVANSWTGWSENQSGNVSVIDADNNTVVYTVSIGLQPGDVTWDPNTGEVYVTNGEQGTVSILAPENSSPPPTVTFAESGLPSGTEWNVTLGEQFGYSLAAPIQFDDPNGTYAFELGATTGYSAFPLSGNISVNWSDVAVSIDFYALPPPEQFPITFNESGLEAGVIWSIDLDGFETYSYSSAILANVPNGSYSFSVNPVSGYSVRPQSGEVIVNGSAVTISIAFLLLPPPSLYEVDFNEGGLPTGTEWSVDVGGSLKDTSESFVVFTVANGTYSFNISDSAGYSPNPSSGVITVNGSSLLTTVVFYPPPPPPTYLVTFLEAGLPNGVQWYLNATGPIELYSGSMGTATGGMLPNGTYTYTISSSDKLYRPIPAAGSFTVSGAPLSENVTFQLVIYSVTFSETGLPPGVTWSVNLNGTVHESNGSYATFEEPNGTFGYAVTRVPGYTLGPTPGIVTVAGENQRVTLSFSVPTYQVIFTATGLPRGVDWIVEAPWGDNESNSTDLVVWEPNGTYKFDIQAPNGYTADPSSGTLDIAGTSVAIAVNFTAVTTQHQGPPPGPGIPNWVWILAITVVFAAGLGIVISILSRKPAPPVNP